MMNGNYSGVPPIDPFPATGSALIDAGDAAHAAADDFNGTPRSGAADVGAYKFDEGGNPGWQITAAFKFIADVTRPNPPEKVQAD